MRAVRRHAPVAALACEAAASVVAAEGVAVTTGASDARAARPGGRPAATAQDGE